MISWQVVVSKLCINYIKMVNVHRKDYLVYTKNFESQVLATGYKTHWNLLVCVVDMH